jgi:mannose-6-phosphate isomerase-like protein (cupin superfamily)
MLDIQSADQVKTVIKPWGWEKWIQPGSDTYPFVLKQLKLSAGQRTSLQVHKQKSESIIILEGTGQILTYCKDFDCELYLNNGYTTQDLETIIQNLSSLPLQANTIIHTPPGTIHRMIAFTDLVYIEASTTELDDVIRLQDDNNRQHGRIDAEHK